MIIEIVFYYKNNIQGGYIMSISTKTRQAYSEIDEFISLLTIEEQNEIPKKLREFFKEQKDSKYVRSK